MAGGIGAYDDSPLTTIRSYVQGLGIRDESAKTRLINELSRALSIGADAEIGEMSIGEALNSNSLWTGTIKPGLVGDSFTSRTQNQQSAPKKYKGDLDYPPGVVYDGEIAHHNEQNHRWQDGNYVSWAYHGFVHSMDRLFAGKSPW